MIPFGTPAKAYETMRAAWIKSLKIFQVNWMQRPLVHMGGWNNCDVE
jgi:hypothetical protein